MAAPKEVLEAALTMECQFPHFHIKYIGIPLAIRKPSSEAFKTLVDTITDCLLTWNASTRLSTIGAGGDSSLPAPVLGLYEMFKKQADKITGAFSGQESGHTKWPMVVHHRSMPSSTSCVSHKCGLSFHW